MPCVERDKKSHVPLQCVAKKSKITIFVFAKTRELDFMPNAAAAGFRAKNCKSHIYIQEQNNLSCCLFNLCNCYDLWSLCVLRIHSFHAVELPQTELERLKNLSVEVRSIQ